jgi:hypothetical protein
MEKSLILKLAPYILKRFEQNLDDGGLLFLYNVNTNETWTGNASSYYLIKLINGEKTLTEIYTELLPLFEQNGRNEVIQCFDALLSNLLDRNFLEVAA